MEGREHSLVVSARGLIAQRIELPEIGRALEVAKNSRGIVLQSASDAMENADAGRLISDGIKALAGAKATVLEIPKAMVAAVNAVCKPLETALAEGKKARGDAAVAYRDMVAAAEREAAVERQREADRLAAEARERAAAEGPSEPEEEVVPLAPPPPPEKPQTLVRGGAGKQVFVETLQCEMVNPFDCDPSWLTLRNADALAWFREQMKRGDQPKPGDRANPIEARGVRYWYVTSVQDR